MKDQYNILDKEKSTKEHYVIRESVTEINNGAFRDCIELVSIEIPHSITKIGNEAFRGCTRLSTIELPESIEYFGEYVFGECISLKSIKIPNSVANIGDYAFIGCKSLNFIEIPISVENIGICAFSGCSSISNIKIPDSVVNIEDYAFWGCSLIRNIEIPESVNNIGNGAFSCCKNLTSINVSSLNNTYMSIDGVLYKKGMNELVAFPSGKRIESYTIPQSVTTLCDYAFAGCGNSFSGYCKLNSIIIHKDIKKIGQKCFLYCNTYFELHFQSNDPYSINVQLKEKDISKISLFVPIGTVYAYKRHPVFSKFKRIKSENIRNV